MIYADPVKGISLTVDQYKALLVAVPHINASLQEKGIDISGEAPDDKGEKETKPKISKPKKEKANIEATSDEEED